MKPIKITATIGRFQIMRNAQMCCTVRSIRQIIKPGSGSLQSILQRVYAYQKTGVR